MQLTAYVSASNLAFMIVVTPAMASRAPGRKTRHGLVPRATAWRSLVGWGEWLRRAVAGGCSWAFFMPLSLKSLSNLTRERERNGGSQRQHDEARSP